MKFLRNKKLTTALMLTITVSLFATGIPLVSAQSQTFFYVLLSPNPVGVGQTVVITLQLNQLITNAQGFECTITDSSGNVVDHQGPVAGNPVAAQWFTWIPTEADNYTVTGTWAGSGQYAKSTGVATLIVQEDPIPNVASVPLPVDSWMRPVYGENKDWWTVADNWLMFSYDRTDKPERRQSCFAPYTSAPESAHILWNRPLQFGGIVGGRLGDNTYYTGNSYEQHYIPIIINGLIIYTEHSPDGSTQYGTRCINLYTGEDVWYLDRTDLAFAQTMLVNNVNEHGVLPYLWFGSQTSYTIFDPFTAEQLFSFSNVPSGTMTIGPTGEVLVYSLSGGTLSMWSSSQAMGATNTGSSFTPSGTISGSGGTVWQTTLQGATGNLALINPDEGFVLLAPATGFSSGGGTRTHVAYSIPTDYSSPGSSISPLWSLPRTSLGEMRLSANIGDGTYAIFDAGPLTFEIYNMTTGALIRKTEPLESGWGTFTYVHHIAYGKLISIGYDGYVHGFDVTKDSTEDDWHYYFGNSGLENAYGSYPTWNGMTIADGKVFVCADEHSADAIPWRGGKLWVVEVATGELAWEISGWHKVPVISDGIATAVNCLDMQIYTFGKGPSATTVSAPNVAVPLGTSIVITGTVTDQTPSSKDTPAISDEWMSAWMEYMYMQKPYPEDATGVEVYLEVIDSNDNRYIIGTTTTDNTGNFGFTYTPQIPGNFTVIATFPGSNSYDMSIAKTYFTIGEAESDSAAVEYPRYGTDEWPAYPQYTTTELLIIVAVVVAIVVGVINLVLLLKKQK